MNRQPTFWSHRKGGFSAEQRQRLAQMEHSKRSQRISTASNGPLRVAFGGLLLIIIGAFWALLVGNIGRAALMSNQPTATRGVHQVLWFTNTVEPSSTPQDTATPFPTFTPTGTSSPPPVPMETQQPTKTLRPTATETPTPTATVIPSATPTEIPLWLQKQNNDIANQIRRDNLVMDVWETLGSRPMLFLLGLIVLALIIRGIPGAWTRASHQALASKSGETTAEEIRENANKKMPSMYKRQYADALYAAISRSNRYPTRVVTDEEIDIVMHWRMRGLNQTQIGQKLNPTGNNQGGGVGFEKATKVLAAFDPLGEIGPKKITPYPTGG